MQRSLKSAKTCLFGCAVAVALSAPPGFVHARGISVLHAFSGELDGEHPSAGLMMDSAGNLYGTTLYGGGGGGTVFKVAPDGTETVLHSFGASDGGSPFAGVIADKKGELYGTTEVGGTSNQGTVFQLKHDGREKVLYSFKGVGVSDGGFPLSPLIRDSAGNLYGTTFEGGLVNCNAGYGCGTVYRLAPDGTETVLHEFRGKPDGDSPFYGGLVMDEAGNLYGTTSYGGTHGYGTVYKVMPDGTETVLHSFQGEADGAWPKSGLIADENGNLYGTTGFGGTNGTGDVFRIAPDGTETVLYSFGGYGTADGDEPVGSVIRDSAGNLYGTTQNGGAHGEGGTIFKLAPDGTETVLASFSCPNDGCYPQDALIMDTAGNLYGTAFQKGPVACAGRKSGCGTVFTIRK